MIWTGIYNIIKLGLKIACSWLNKNSDKEIMLKQRILLFVLIFAFAYAEPADASTQKTNPEQQWGISAGVRIARIPFATDQTTTDWPNQPTLVQQHSTAQDNTVSQEQ